MLRGMLRFFLLIAVLSLVACSGERTIPPGNYMIVISAKRGQFDHDVLHLEQVEQLLLFTDRPKRKVLHRDLSQIVSLWEQGEHSLAQTPPNATLSILSNRDDTNIVMQLGSPITIDDSVQFKVKVLDGLIPKSFGVSTLFIDGTGKPATPKSSN